MNINKYNFRNDKQYYSYILNLKTPFSKSKKTFKDKEK
jgi:hypothetical protein